MKVTVSEYAQEFKTSVQSVYQRIKRGTLNSVEENGVKYVILDDDNNGATSKHSSIEKSLMKLVKVQQKEIKRLTKELAVAQAGKNEVLEKFIFEMQQISHNPGSSNVVDVKAKKKKRRKKR